MGPWSPFAWLWAIPRWECKCLAAVCLLAAVITPSITNIFVEKTRQILALVVMLGMRKDDIDQQGTSISLQLDGVSPNG